MSSYIGGALQVDLNINPIQFPQFWSFQESMPELNISKRYL